MTSARQQRLYFFLCMGLAVGLALILILMSLRDHIIYFYAPHEITPALQQTHQPFRMGGLVAKNSYKLHTQAGPIPLHSFNITDDQKTFTVHYQGLLPDLFREGQGIIVQGTFENPNSFKATEVLAKHDETYMPPEVARHMNLSCEKALNHE